MQFFLTKERLKTRGSNTRRETGGTTKAKAVSEQASYVTGAVLEVAGGR